jgi:ABC-type sugar transport system permease subunit/ABC-type glycerol-3-phosphate transport system substrate-binding protein
MLRLVTRFFLTYLVAIFTLLCSHATQAADTTLVVWGIGEGDGSVGLFAALEAFEKDNPGVHIRTSPAGGGQNPQKMLTAVVGGAAPDVINQDRFTVSSWAARRAFLPLDDFLAAQTGPDQIIPDEYYSATWKETVFEGEVYAIPNGTDARALYYNSDLLHRAGLTNSDGEVVPPETWRDLGLYSLRLTLTDAIVDAGILTEQGKLIAPYSWRDAEMFTLMLCTHDNPDRLREILEASAALPEEWTTQYVDDYRFTVSDQAYVSGTIGLDGKFVPPESWRFLRVGYVPIYGNVWLHMYAWQTHGRFMTADKRGVTLHDPKIVTALSWMTDFYDMLGGRPKLEGFTSSFQGEFLNPFLTGLIALVVNTDGLLGDIARYRPDLQFGVTLTPLPPGGKPTTWSGGFSYAIPRNARHPALAWRFIRFMASERASRLIERTRLNYNRSRGRPYVMPIPANKVIGRRLIAENIDGNPTLPAELKYAYHQYADMMEFSDFRDVTPASQILWDETQRATDMATYGKLTPEAALREGSATVQAELDRLYRDSQGSVVDWFVVFGGVIFVVLATAAIFAGIHRDRLHMGYIARRDLFAGIGFVSPWLVGFFLLIAGPFIFSVALSFTEYDILSPAHWVGLQHYTELFSDDPIFWKSLWNTVYMMMGIPLGMAVGLGIAMLLNSDVKGMSLYRTIYYLPAIVPVVAASILWIWVLHPTNGVLNILLDKLGMGSPLWLQSEDWSKPAIIVMGLWSAGSSMIIWLAGLKGIPDHLYEAAQIDGAGAWSRFRHVTIPMLSPYIFFNLIMGIIGTLQIFTQAFIMTAGGPVDSTLFYVYYLFNNAFQYLRMGYASAMAWILFVIILALTLVQLKLAPRWVHYEGEEK